MSGFVDGEYFVDTFETVSNYIYNRHGSTYHTNRNDEIILSTSTSYKLALYFTDFDVGKQNTPKYKLSCYVTIG